MTKRKYRRNADGIRLVGCIPALIVFDKSDEDLDAQILWFNSTNKTVKIVTPGPEDSAEWVLLKAFVKDSQCHMDLLVDDDAFGGASS